MASWAAERLNLGLGVARVAGFAERILADLRARPAAGDPGIRQLAAQLAIEARVLRHLGQRALCGTGPTGEVLKLASSRLARRTDEMLDALRGAGAMLHDEYTLAQLWTPAVSVGGGADEVVRDVVAERVLGLPRQPRP
jgi:alkylation response protein AidB-like acyl-CoA dehydrogenase